MAAVGVVLVFEAEHHVALAFVAGRGCGYGKGDLGLLVAGCRADSTPVRYGLDFPFAFGVDDECLLVLCAEGACYRRTSYKLVMRGNTLEITPAYCGLVLRE